LYYPPHDLSTAKITAASLKNLPFVRGYIKIMLMNMKNFLKKNEWYILGAFAAVELAIYVAFLVIETTQGYNPIALKYSGILLCLAVSLLMLPVHGKDGIFAVVSSFFTAISDLFIFVLLLYVPGVCTFIVVQTVFFIRIYFIMKKKPYISLAVRVGLMAIALITLGCMGFLNALTALVCIYFPMLLCNTVESAFLIKISKRYILLFIGLILFMGCDICVGILNIAQVGVSIPQSALDIIATVVWVFYLPSQTVIALAAHDPQPKTLAEEINERR